MDDTKIVIRNGTLDSIEKRKQKGEEKIWDNDDSRWNDKCFFFQNLV